MSDGPFPVATRMQEPADIELHERRSTERRTDLRVADLSLPEFRRIVITSVLFVIVLSLFLWMVRTVIIAAFMGIVIAIYLRPAYLWFAHRLNNDLAGAITTLSVAIVPVLGLLAYSYFELAGVAEYLSANEREIAMEIDGAIQRLPFLGGSDVSGSVRRSVGVASSYGTRLPGMASNVIGGFTVGASVFLFTAFYFFLDAPRIASYLREKVPPRYVKLVTSLEQNAGGVLHGAIYATLLTQTIKSAVILALNLILGVPLAVVLAVVSFIIGFFPIVGSWSVYVPVAGWLLVFQDDLVGALIMLGVGFFANTVFFSMYLRPKLAADKSRVLNFYWMFIGLVTGVYTFGIAGILLGPILIGVLKAVVDTVTSSGNWLVMEDDEEELLSVSG